MSDQNRRTPTHVLSLARQVLGTIDLDPASDFDGNERVLASRWYGPGSPFFGDGLTSYWYGRVFLNPPGDRIGRASGPAEWWTKLVSEYDAGHVTEAIFVGFALEVLRTGQRKCRPPYALPMCVPATRLRFPGSDGRPGDSPNISNVIVYLGHNVQVFRSVFSALGYCT